MAGAGGDCRLVRARLCAPRNSAAAGGVSPGGPAGAVRIFPRSLIITPQISVHDAARGAGCFISRLVARARASRNVCILGTVPPAGLNTVRLHCFHLEARARAHASRTCSILGTGRA